MTQVHQVPVEDLHPSPTNPRKDLGDLTELVQSIRLHGILEPALARRLPDGSIELMAGHRRRGAGELAGLETIPTLVRKDVTDDQVLDIQLAENIDRNDLTPLEEAEAYQLRLDRGQTLAHIADTIGRPRAYIAKRISLLALDATARKALGDGRITLGAAQVLCRVPGKLQAEATRNLLNAGADEHMIVSERFALDFVQRDYMLRLADAPFDRASADLVSDAPPCLSCPKRTGNQAELFDDIKSPDVCTDPACYRRKLGAHWKIVSKQARADGRKVLSKEEARQVFPHVYNPNPVYGSAFRSREETEWMGTRSVKVGSLVGKDVEVALAQNPHTGQIVELVPREAVEKAKRAKLAKPAKGSAEAKLAADEAKQRKERKIEREKARVRHAAVQQAIGEAVARIDQIDRDFLIEIAAASLIAAGWVDIDERVLARRGIELKKNHHAHACLEAAAKEIPPAELLFELCLQQAAPWNPNWVREGTGGIWDRALERVQVSFAEIHRALAAEQAREKKPKAAKKKTKKATKKPAKKGTAK